MYYINKRRVVWWQCWNCFIHPFYPKNIHKTCVTYMYRGLKLRKAKCITILKGELREPKPVADKIFGSTDVFAIWFYSFTINFFNSNLLPILINSTFINKKRIPVPSERALNIVTWRLQMTSTIKFNTFSMFPNFLYLVSQQHWSIYL